MREKQTDRQADRDRQKDRQRERERERGCHFFVWETMKKLFSAESLFTWSIGHLKPD